MDEFEDQIGLTPMQEGIANIHELFTSLVAGGFTEMQALIMLGVMLAHAQGNSTNGTE